MQASSGLLPQFAHANPVVQWQFARKALQLIPTLRPVLLPVSFAGLVPFPLASPELGGSPGTKLRGASGDPAPSPSATATLRLKGQQLHHVVRKQGGPISVVVSYLTGQKLLQGELDCGDSPGVQGAP